MCALQNKLVVELLTYTSVFVAKQKEGAIGIFLIGYTMLCGKDVRPVVVGGIVHQRTGTHFRNGVILNNEPDNGSKLFRKRFFLHAMVTVDTKSLSSGSAPITMCENIPPCMRYGFNRE